MTVKKTNGNNRVTSYEKPMGLERVKCLENTNEKERVANRETPGKQKQVNGT